MRARDSLAMKAAALATAIGAGVLLAGCGSASSHALMGMRGAPFSAPLTTSLAASGANWAVVPLTTPSGPFWELLAQEAGSESWTLVTPPGVADNGGLVVGSPGGQSLVAAFRPTEGLRFSPLATTLDAGQTWSPGLLDAGVADVPDALAAGPGGRLLALAPDGQVMQSTAGGARWSSLTSVRSLARGPGRSCGLTRLTAAAFSPSGTALLAGACGHGAAAGVFAYRGGAWQAAGPALPSSLAGRPVQVLRMTAAGSGDLALLAVRTSTSVSLVAARTSDAGRHWAMSAPLRLGGSSVASVAFGDDGAVGVTLPRGRAEVWDGAGASWLSLPALPAGTAALAVIRPAGQFEALAIQGVHVAVWRLTAATAGWTRVQTLSVPIN